MSGRILRPNTNDSILELPEIGRIGIGEKRLSQNGKEYPVALDYFKARGVYAPAFEKAFESSDGKPNVIQVIFPDDDPEKVCNERYELRDGSGALVASGDGQVFQVWNGKKYVEYSAAEHPDIMERLAARYPRKPKDENDNGWDITLTMRFIIPAVRGIVGVWQLTTKGAASSVRNIRESFDAVQAMRKTVTGTVFDLAVKFAKSNKPGVTSRYPVISLTANDQRFEEMRELLKPADGRNLLLQE